MGTNTRRDGAAARRPSVRRPSVRRPSVHRLGRWQLVRRSIAHRRVQSAVVVVTAALLIALAAFAPWYKSLVDLAITRQAMSADVHGTSWRLLSEENADLADLLPASSRSLFEQPVAGRQADIGWATAQVNGVRGGLAWKEGICDHLDLVEGSCPQTSSEVPVEIAVSSADAQRYGLAVGDAVQEQGGLAQPVEFTIVGIYQVRDATDPFWFGVTPDGRSGFDNDETPLADLFVLGSGGFEAGSDRPFWNILELRVDADQVTRDDVATLRTDTAALFIEAKHNKTDLDSGIAATADELERGWQITATVLTMALAQVAALAVVVVGMLARVVLLQRRSELGLARLRGQGVRRLAETLISEWSAIVLLGALVGSVLGVGLVWMVRDLWLSPDLGLAPPWTVGAAVVGTVAVSIAVMALLARPTVREPISALLRPNARSVDSASVWHVLLDAIAVTAALCAVLVGLQSSAASALVLLTPSLLAVAVTMLGSRLLIRICGVLARRWMSREHPARALTAVLLSRSQGSRALLIVIAMAIAFVTFSTQLSAVGERDRRHQAEIETGAVAVSRTRALPAEVEAALNAVDPDRERATFVVSTRRADAGALGALFVEPDAFRRIALGAEDAATPAAWDAVSAPGVEPITFTGDRLELTVEPHTWTGDENGKRAEVMTVAMDYLQADGRLATAQFDSITAAADEERRLRAPINCENACRLIRWRLDPDGPASGEVSLTEVVTRSDTGSTSLPLGAAEDWQQSVGAAQKVTVSPGEGSLRLTFASGGSAIGPQHAYVPTRIPVFLAPRHPAGSTGSNATITSPGDEILPIDVVGQGRGPVPRMVRDVGVSDVAGVLRRGEISASATTLVQIWYAPEGLADRARLDRQLREHGVTVTPVDTVAQRREQLSGSAVALTARTYPGAGIFAVILAGLALVLWVASQWRTRARDFAALRMVGVSGRALARTASGMCLVLVGVAALIGTGCGLIGFLLAVERLPLSVSPDPAIPPDLSPDPWVGLVTALISVGVLSATAIGCGRWLLGRSDLDRVREAGP